MTTREMRFLGVRTTLFAGNRRAGLELSVPLPMRRRSFGTEASLVAPAPAQPPSNPETAALAQQVADLTWYHTIDLGYGVVTPGFYDHKPILDRYLLPQRLDGKRVLDIAAFDGFWAFEFERRGAAEVIALDIATARELDLPFHERERMTDAQLDRPFGKGFALAHATLHSKVRHQLGNVYALSRESLGAFDLVHCGDLLLHLRDPALALANIRRVTSGEALISDVIYPDLDRHDGAPMLQYEGGAGENIWWRMGATALKRMISDAGFSQIEEIARFRYGPRGNHETMWHIVLRASP